jgi:hypothetical protein
MPTRCSLAASSFGLCARAVPVALVRSNTGGERARKKAALVMRGDSGEVGDSPCWSMLMAMGIWHREVGYNRRVVSRCDGMELRANILDDPTIYCFWRVFESDASRLYSGLFKR